MQLFEKQGENRVRPHRKHCPAALVQNHHALPTHGNHSVAFLHDPNQVCWYGFLKGKTVYGVRQKDGTQKFPHFDQPDPSEIFFVPSFCATPYRFLALQLTVPTHLVCFVQKRDKRVPDPPGSDAPARDSEPRAGRCLVLLSPGLILLSPALVLDGSRRCCPAGPASPDAPAPVSSGFRPDAGHHSYPPRCSG